MKKLINILAIVIGAISLSSCGYNSMVEKDEAVSQQWAQVENVYQRRLDLIPNLVEVVKQASNVEKEILIGVSEARAGALRAQENSAGGKNLKEYQQAQSRVGLALGNLMGYVERYPELKSIQGFSDLQAQLEGTENRISVERMKYNDAVKDYNSYIRKFPKNLIAGWFDFEKREYFEAEQGAAKAPKVKF